MSEIDVLIARRPTTLTLEKAEKCLPRYDVDPEWLKKKDEKEAAGEKLEFADFMGMLAVELSATKLTVAEAEWILALYEVGSMRWVAGVVFYGDTNQITGSDIIECADEVIVASEFSSSSPRTARPESEKENGR